MFQRRQGRFRPRSNGRSSRRQSHGHSQRSNSFTNNGHARNGYRPTQSPAKLLEKYSALAKEALSAGDKVLSENYLQHVDHFERVVNLRNSNQNDKSTQETNLTKEQNSNSSSGEETIQDEISKNK